MRIDEDKAVVIVILTAMLFATLIIVVTRAYGDVEIDYKQMSHEAIMSEILFLESSHGKLLQGKDGEWGVAQFKLQTFEWLKYKAGMPWLNWMDNSDQVVLLDWAIRSGYSSHWSTYKRAEQRAIMGKYIKLK